MDIDPVKVGKRIKAAREAVGLMDCQALADKIFQDTAKKGRIPINAETVRLWEVGNHLPPWDKLEQLGVAINMGSKEILFGPMRDTQLRREHPLLAYIDPSEADLLTHFRRASPACQRRIVGLVKNMADDDPTSSAELHTITRK